MSKSSFVVGDRVELSDALIDEVRKRTDTQELYQALDASDFIGIIRKADAQFITISPQHDSSIAMTIAAAFADKMLRKVSGTPEGAAFSTDDTPLVVSQAFSLLNMLLDVKQDSVEQACQIYKFNKNMQRAETYEGGPAVSDDDVYKPFEIRLGSTEQGLLDTAAAVLTRYMKTESKKLFAKPAELPVAQHISITFENHPPASALEELMGSLLGDAMPRLEGRVAKLAAVAPTTKRAKRVPRPPKTGGDAPQKG